MPEILTVPRSCLPPLPIEGVWPVDDLPWLDAGEWRDRSAAEHDESSLQPIVYLLLRNASSELWSYARVAGDARLHGRYSCGLGGHVDRTDAQPGKTSLDTLNRALRREFDEELGISAFGGITAWPTRPLALIYEGHSAVGRVHIGLLYCAEWAADQDPQPMHGEALSALGFRPLQGIVDDSRFELWSRLCARWLSVQS